MKKKIIVVSVILLLLPCLLVFSNERPHFGQVPIYDETIDSTDAKIILNAPDSGVIGELIELDASKSSATSFTWRVIPNTDNFKIIEDGRKAIFCSGRPGTYTFILSAAKRDTVDCIVHIIIIKGAPVINTLTKHVRSWLPENADPVILEKLARSFERVASAGHTDVAVLVKTTALSNRGILGPELEEWTPFLKSLSVYLKSNYAEATVDQHIELWFKLAAALRSI